MNPSDLKKIKWYKQGAAGWVVTSSMPWLAIKHGMKKVSGFEMVDSMYFTFVLPNGTIFAHFFSEDKNLVMARKIMKYMLEKPAHFTALAKRFYAASAGMEALGLDLVKKGIEDRNFKKNYQRFYDFSMCFWVNSLFLDVLDVAEGEFLETVLGKYYRQLLPEQRALLVSPLGFSNIQKEQSGLLKIYRMAVKKMSADKVKAALEKHARSFYWIKSDYETVHHLDAAFYRRKLDLWLKNPDEVREVEESLRKNLAIQKKKKTLMARLKMGVKDRKNLEVLDLLTVLRDDRKRANNIGNYVLLTSAEKIARKLKVDEKVIKMATVDELPLVMENPKMIAELKKRVKYGVWAYRNDYGKTVFRTGSKVKKWLAMAESTLQQAEIKGTVACYGKRSAGVKNVTRGKAKIVLCQGDFKKMSAGDVLVANMTRPEYFPLMKMASAIVTDEGGITCHAAIVSRELGVTCIIGTQVATKRLKDGDLVEVDAKKGIVKIIK